MLETNAGANATQKKALVNGVELKVSAYLLKIFGLTKAMIVAETSRG